MYSVLFLLLVLLYYSNGDAIQITESAMIVKRVKILTCNSAVNLSRMPGRMMVYHKWNQDCPGERNSSAIILPPIEAFETRYSVELHKFDNNTNIYSKLSVYNASNELEYLFNFTIHCSGLQRKWISLVDDDFYRYQVDHIFTHGYSKIVKFNCLQYLHLSNLLEIQIGWINTAGDKIFMYKQTEIIINLSDVHNGSMVCCLYYTTSAYKNRTHIQRFVKDITLLIYQKETLNVKGQPTGTTTESYCENESNRNITPSSTTTQFIADTSNATTKISDTTNKTGITSGTANETSKYSGTTNETDQKPNNTNTTGKPTGTTNETDQKPNNTNTTGKPTGTTNETDQKPINTNTTGKTTGSANETSKYSGTTNETEQKPNNTNTTGKTTGATNRTDSSNHDADTDYAIIIISSLAATMVLLLVGICAIRRHYWKKPDRPKRAQIPLPQIPGARLRPANETDSNTPFYLNRLFRRECELEIQARGEPHYEEVMYQ